MTFNPEEIVVRGNALFQAEQSKNLTSNIVEKMGNLRHYDVLAMDRAVAILAWGRSGSLLLASYLDGHPDILMLPELCGWRLYEFFDAYRSLSLRDKLIAYPAFRTDDTRFFEGGFAISPTEYYAAVLAILKSYGKWPKEFLESRRTFFLFVHIAYNLALGRRPASPKPLIVYAQHDWDNSAARYLVEDFPRAKFIHTIRDPISSCDSAFHQLLPVLAEQNIFLPYSVLVFLTTKDRPQLGMECRSRAIRFEDLHCNVAETMQQLSDWLGFTYQPVLLDSTFNGIPYLVSGGGKTWSGPRLDQARRQSRYFSIMDRALLFALFYENFAHWKYPCPRIFGHRIIRLMTVVLLVLMPTRMEIIGAGAVLERRILPSVRRGNISRAIRSLVAVGFCRLKIMWLFLFVVLRRCAFRTKLVEVC